MLSEISETYLQHESFQVSDAVDGLLTVTSSDGRQKTTQVGNARPAGLVRLMLLELEDERAGDPSEG
jgi:hypothetical protein